MAKSKAIKKKSGGIACQPHIMRRPFPIQPIEDDGTGVLRFRENRIVSFLLDKAACAGVDMNTLAMMSFTDEEKAQFAMLIGYSFGGWSELSYVDDKTYARAARKRVSA